jgi:hypothetical protein
MLPMTILSNLQCALLALALLAATATNSAADLDDHPELQPQDVHEHDRCLVCGGELEQDDGLAFFIKGAASPWIRSTWKNSCRTPLPISLTCNRAEHCSRKVAAAT